MPHKICKSCNQEKDLSDFGKDKSQFLWGAKDGKNIFCKQCIRDKATARRIHLAKTRPPKPKRERKSKAMPETPPYQLKLQLEDTIRRMARKGTSRDEIKRVTNHPMDWVVHVLADLWDRGEVKIKRQGEERLFFLRAA